MNKLFIFSARLVILFLFISCRQPDILITDFDVINFGDWKVEGSAFGDHPARGTFPAHTPAENIVGQHLASTFRRGDTTTGKLTSPLIDIERNYINFLIGGGKYPDQVCVNLRINGKVVRSATGPNDMIIRTNQMNWISWDVSEWKGKQAEIEITDQITGKPDAYINADYFYQSNMDRAKYTYRYDTRKTVKINQPYLNIPVKQGAYPQKMTIYIDEKPVMEFLVELADDEPDFWMFLDMSDWLGKKAVIGIDRINKTSRGLASITADSTVRGFENLYQEELRPQFHFTSRRGWHNDPNGLLFYGGEYHLFYQHNPLGWPWGNMTWGHAISSDLVHWSEMKPALYPDSLGTMFSGSGVVDWNNTAGLEKGPEKTLVVFYTAAGNTSEMSKNKPFTQCMAYSHDKGRTWIKYSDNPVLGHVAAENRDPKVVWHKASGQWIMALFLDKQEFALFASRDLKNWTELQRITIDQGAECPDFFEMPVEGKPGQTKWVLTAANGRFVVGDFDGSRFTPESGSYPSEWGSNYYAVQTYSDLQDGRRIQIGWMAGAEFKGMPFNQQMSFPRELVLKPGPDGWKLCGIPAREISLLHGKKEAWSNHTLKPGENLLGNLKGDLYHIIASFTLPQIKQGEFGFKLHGFEIVYHTASNMLTTYRPSDRTKKEVKILPKKGSITMEILLDRGSVEIFVNEGEVPFAFGHIPAKKDSSISLFTRNSNVILNKMEVYELNPVWKR